MRTAALLCSLALSCSVMLSAGSYHSRRSQPYTGQAGVFDFYLLTLSWEPEYCFSHRSDPDCTASKRGFVVHGLWPQNNDGSYPSNCSSTQPPPSNADELSGIVPAEILQHEWTKHGTCSGLSGNAYFDLIRKSWSSLTIPTDFKAPARSFTVRPTDLKKEFHDANGTIDPQDVVIGAGRGYLQSVEICLTKQGAPMHCPATVYDYNGGTIIVPPLR